MSIGGGYVLAEGEWRLTLSRLPFVAVAGLTIGVWCVFHWPDVWSALSVWQWAEWIDVPAALILACALAARFGDFGAPPWIGVAVMLVLLVAMPLAGPPIEGLFVPPPPDGIDDNSWQEDIPPYVTAAGILSALLVLVAAAVPRSKPARAD